MRNQLDLLRFSEVLKLYIWENLNLKNQELMMLECIKFGDRLQVNWITKITNNTLTSKLHYTDEATNRKPLLKLVEVPCVSIAFNSNYSCLLVDDEKKTCFLWIGSGDLIGNFQPAANKEEEESSSSLIKKKRHHLCYDNNELIWMVKHRIPHLVDFDFLIIKEQDPNTEHSEKYNAYLQERLHWQPNHYSQIQFPKKPRLFQATNSTGIFSVVEVTNEIQCQDDLIHDDMFILDCFDRVFLWDGKNATREERIDTCKCVLDYTSKHPNRKYDPNQVFLVSDGNEPLEFTNAFFAWDFEKPTSISLSELPLVSQVVAKYARSFSLEELTDKERPVELDATKLETYLSENEFDKAFGMTKHEFIRIPSWKQLQLKKSLGLF